MERSKTRGAGNGHGRRRARLAAALLAATALSGISAPGAARAQALAAQHRFDIAAQPLPDAVLLFGRQAGLQVSAESALTRNRSTPGVSGVYAPAEALSRLLEGTGLTFRFLSPSSVQLEAAPRASQGAMELGPVRIEGAAETAPPALDAPPRPYAGGQVARGAKLGMLGNRDVMETPFNLTSYTAQLADDQQARTVGDVLDNDPSIRRAWSASGLYEYFQIRGLYVTSADISFNGLYGVAPRYGGVPVDFAERIEVLKGPSALLNGMSPNGVVGGAINIVPKRAGDAPLTRLTAGVESDSLWRAHLDAGRRFGPQGAWGVRLNASYEDGDTYIDGQSKRGSNTEALAVDYRGERLRLTLDAYRIEDKNRGGVSMGVSLGAGVTTLPGAPDGRTNISPWVNGDADTTAAILGGEYDLADHLTAFAKVGVRRYQYSGFLLSSVFNLQANGDANALVMKFPYDTHGDSEEIGLRGDFRTGPVKHDLVLSGSRQTDDVKVAFAFNSILTNIYSPVVPATLPAASPSPVKSSTLDFTSVALADTMSAWDDRVLLTVGVRRQDVQAKNFSSATGLATASYDKSAWTPMAGLVVKLRDNLSIYGNYIQGLSQGATVGNIYQNAGQVLPPYKTKQLELGAKLETGGVINTLAIFQIAKPSTLVDFTTSPLPTLRLNGEQRNRGIEWNLFGAVTPGLRLLGGATYTQGRLTHTQGGLQDGKDAPGAAPWAANLGFEWDVPDLTGLTLTGRVIATSRQHVDNDNHVSVPAWTRIDLGARFSTAVADRPVVFRASVRNVFDKSYWEGVNSPGTVTLGAPRTFQLSATVDF